MPTVVVTLETAQSGFSDIQISIPEEALHLRAVSHISFVALVNYRLIPLYLISNGPYPVYSENDATEAFFIRSLVQKDLNLGLLSKYLDYAGEMYMVFYVDELTKGIKCVCIDFSVINQVLDFKQLCRDDENVYFTSRTKIVTNRSDTSVFDRVLENKTLKKQAAAAIKDKSPLKLTLVLSTPGQISQIVNKVIFLGLRLRGLTVSGLSSSKDKIAIREIHQMTRKAAMFAVRKFTYDFNACQRSSELLLNDVQDIVESLLRTFVDIPKGDPGLA